MAVASGSALVLGAVMAERRRAQEALAQSANLLRAVLAGTTDATRANQPAGALCRRCPADEIDR